MTAGIGLCVAQRSRAAMAAAERGVDAAGVAARNGRPGCRGGAPHAGAGNSRYRADLRARPDMHDHLGELQRASRSAPGDLPWIGYGDEPWLVTVVSPKSFAAPVVMAVSSRRLVPTESRSAWSPRRRRCRSAMALSAFTPSGRPAALPFLRRCLRRCMAPPWRSCWGPRCWPAIWCCATCIAKPKWRRCAPTSSPACRTS